MPRNRTVNHGVATQLQQKFEDVHRMFKIALFLEELNMSEIDQQELDHNLYLHALISSQLQGHRTGDGPMAVEHEESNLLHQTLQISLDIKTSEVEQLSSELQIIRASMTDLAASLTEKSEEIVKLQADIQQERGAAQAGHDEQLEIEASLRDAHKSLQKELEMNEASLFQLTTELDEKARELKALQLELAALGSEKDKLQHEYNTSQDEHKEKIKLLRDSLNEQSRENNRLQTHHDKTILDLSKEWSRITQTSATLEAEKLEMEAKLNAEIKSREEKTEELKAEKNNYDGQIDGLKTEVARLKQNQSSQAAANDLLISNIRQEHITKISQLMRTHEATLQGAGDDKTKLQQRIDTLEVDNAQLVAQKSDSDADARRRVLEHSKYEKSTKEEIEELRNTIKDNDKVARELKTLSERARERADNEARKLTDVTRDKFRLELELGHVKADLTAAHEELETTEAQLSADNATLSKSVQLQKEDYDGKLQQRDSEISDLQRTLQQERLRVQELEQEHNNQKQWALTAMETMESNRKRLAHLEDEVPQLRGMLTAADEKSAHMKVALTEAEQKSSKLEDEHRDMMGAAQNELSREQALVHSLRQQVAQAESSLKHSRQSLSNAQKIIDQQSRELSFKQTVIHEAEEKVGEYQRQREEYLHMIKTDDNKLSKTLLLLNKTKVANAELQALLKKQTVAYGNFEQERLLTLSSPEASERRRLKIREEAIKRLDELKPQQTQQGSTDS